MNIKQELNNILAMIDIAQQSPTDADRIVKSRMVFDAIKNLAKSVE